MKRLLLTGSILSVLTFGCGHSLMQPATPDAQQATANSETTQTEASGSEEASAAEPASSGAALRQPGEFATYRFSGSYRSTPVTVSYRVVERDRATITLDVSSTTEGQSQRFRLKMTDGPSGSGEILSAARFDGVTSQPVDPSEYEALMQQTIAPIEHNEADLERQDHELAVGARTVACTRATYRVLADGRTATMTIFESPSFAWGDLGGEITTADGGVLYKAEIVDVGTDSSPSSHAIAVTVEEYDLYELDL
jgi:hypothetical protein